MPRRPIRAAELAGAQACFAMTGLLSLLRHACLAACTEETFIGATDKARGGRLQPSVATKCRLRCGRIKTAWDGEGQSRCAICSADLRAGISHSICARHEPLRALFVGELIKTSTC